MSTTYGEAEERVLLVTDHTRGDSPWLDALIDRLIAPQAPRCRHLRRRPGIGYVHADEGRARCLACHRGHAAAIAAGGGRGGGPGDACDRCRARVGATRLTTAAVAVGPRVILANTCPRCEVRLLREAARGGEPRQPAAQFLMQG